jgi:hypothetical protein
MFLTYEFSQCLAGLDMFTLISRPDLGRGQFTFPRNLQTVLSNAVLFTAWHNLVRKRPTSAHVYVSSLTFILHTKSSYNVSWNRLSNSWRHFLQCRRRRKLTNPPPPEDSGPAFRFSPAGRFVFRNRRRSSYRIIPAPERGARVSASSPNGSNFRTR